MYFLLHLLKILFASLPVGGALVELCTQLLNSVLQLIKASPCLDKLGPDTSGFSSSHKAGQGVTVSLDVG